MSDFSGDKTKWLVASKDAVIGGWYQDTEREVLQSSLNTQPHLIKWNRHPSVPSNPYITLVDRYNATDTDLLYLGKARPKDSKNLREHNGANVFIRLKGMN